MHLAALICLTMAAFAANSILTRYAIDARVIDPVGFAFVRVLSGAIVLGALVAYRGGALPLLRRNRLPGAASLAVYMIGFSLAYLTLDAGLGALILFGVVQVTMFTYGALRSDRPTRRQVCGAAIAFAGLVVALWPGAGGASDLVGATLMICAGLGWAAYTLLGQGATDPLAATAANFILCLPLMAFLLLTGGIFIAPQGIILGVVCGGLTSGLGYALWYHVLPNLRGSTAAVLQLSVPILAILAGALLLGERLDIATLLAAALVVGGIAWTVTAPARARPD